jgi:hypothetical protein
MPNCSEYSSSGDVHHTYLLDRKRRPYKIFYAAIEGQAVYQGDIVLGTIEDMETIRKALEENRGVIPYGLILPDPNGHWPNGRVQYCISPQLQTPSRVREAIRHWEKNTPIRFQDLGNLCKIPIGIVINHVNFMPGNECSSQVGYQHNIQSIILGAGCDVGATIHEIGHTVGLFHEHCRSDRDRYVVIHWENIPDNQKHNFAKEPSSQDQGEYDFDSIMHYDGYAFAIDPTKPTITTIPPGKPIGQRKGLSRGDIAAVKAMYSRWRRFWQGISLAVTAQDPEPTEWRGFGEGVD